MTTEKCNCGNKSRDSYGYCLVCNKPIITDVIDLPLGETKYILVEELKQQVDRLEMLINKLSTMVKHES